MPAFLKVCGSQMFICQSLEDPDSPADLEIEVTPEIHRQLLILWHANCKGKVPAEKRPWPAGGSMDGFDPFWAAYPKKIVKSEAARIWVQKGLSKHADAITNHVRRMADTPDWQKDGGKYVPMPTTYLNQRRWEDEPVEQPQENWL